MWESPQKQMRCNSRRLSCYLARTAIPDCRVFGSLLTQWTVNWLSFLIRGVFVGSAKRRRGVDGCWRRAADVVDGALQLSTDAQGQHSPAHLTDHPHQLRLQQQNRSDRSDQCELARSEWPLTDTCIRRTVNVCFTWNRKVIPHTGIKQHSIASKFSFSKDGKDLKCLLYAFWIKGFREKR